MTGSGPMAETVQLVETVRSRSYREFAEVGNRRRQVWIGMDVALIIYSAMRSILATAHADPVPLIDLHILLLYEFTAGFTSTIAGISELITRKA